MNPELSWLKIASLNCCEASHLQSRSLEQSLPWRARLGLRLHLLLCKWCRRYALQVRFLRVACRHVETGSLTVVPYKLSNQARDNLKEMLRRELP